MLWKRASVLTCLLLGTWACDSSSSSDMDLTDASSEMSADPVRGKPLYDKFCGFCHGDEGQGYLADNANALSNQSFLAAATRAQILPPKEIRQQVVQNDHNTTDEHFAPLIEREYACNDHSYQTLQYAFIFIAHLANTICLLKRIKLNVSQSSRSNDIRLEAHHD